MGMRASDVFSRIIGAAMLLGCSMAHAEDPKDATLKPAAPDLNAAFYIKVKNAQTTEYCATENLGAPACAIGDFWEAKDECAAPYKVASVSCALSDFDYGAHIVENATDVKQVTGSCVWAFIKLPADKAPKATTSLLCVK